MSSPPIPWLTEPQALSLYATHPALLDACSDYHLRHGTDPAHTPLLVRVTAAGVEVEPIDTLAAVQDSGAGEALASVAPEQAAPPLLGTYPRHAVAALILALAGASPGHPALGGIGEAVALCDRLLSAVRAACALLPPGPARAELLTALTALTALTGSAER